MDNNVPDIVGSHFQVSLAGPAAGNNFNYTLPTGFRYRLKSLYCEFTASAVVATRMPSLRLRNVAVYYLRLPGTFPMAASENWELHWAAGLYVPTNLNVLWQYNPIPIDCYMPGGAQIYSDINGMDAGDQLSGPCITFDRWVEVATPPLD